MSEGAEGTGPEAAALSQAVRLLASVAEELKRITGSTTVAGAAASAATSAAKKPQGKDPSGVEGLVPGWEKMSDEEITAKLKEKFQAKKESETPGRDEKGRFVKAGGEPSPADSPPRNAKVHNWKAAPKPKTTRLGRVGGFVGAGIGAVLGARLGPAGSAAGKFAGQRIGQKAGDQATRTTRKLFVGAKKTKPGRFLGAFGKRTQQRGSNWLTKTKVGRAGLHLKKSLQKVFAAKSPASKGKATLDAVVALHDFTKALRESAQTALEANRKYSEVSAAMAMAFAQLETKQLFRDMETGNRLSGSAKDLADSEDYASRNSQELEILGGRVKNWLGTAADYIAGSVAAPLNEIAGAVNKLVEQGSEKEGKAIGFGETMKILFDEAERREKEGKNRIQDTKQGDARPGRPQGVR